MLRYLLPVDAELVMPFMLLGLLFPVLTKEVVEPKDDEDPPLCGFELAATWGREA